ncbi:MAG TPA: acetate--CoA ligase family protein [Candidatus Baltobacteraceae bacterium]|nr:acetate--CoA ligase family protein [Candidatus Baltobacteraceae bacterium]
MHELDPVLSPRSIAVVGASRREGTIGYTVTLNLIEGKFPGPIYPINPGATEICGLKAYPAIESVPEPVDAAVYCVPADKVLDVVRQCAKAGVKGHIIITSGFAEVGKKDVEDEVVRIARESGGRVIGPNIIGVMSNPAKANASFCPMLPYPGHTALVSQSGALILALDTVTFARRFGISSMISLGNMADVDLADCIEYYAQDPNTKCIALYVEGAKNGYKFMQAGRWAGKPIVTLKAGVSAHGAAAAASHTGSLAGSVKVYQAACNQARMIWANDLDDLLNKSQALSMQPTLKGENVVIITNGGGIGVLGTDAAERHGIPLKTAPADVQAEFRKYMPDYGSAKNPVDITGGSGVAGYEGAIEAALKSPWVDGVCVFYCETAVTKGEIIAQAVINKLKESGVTNKPVIACFVGGASSVDGGRLLLEANIPYYDCPNKAMAAMAALRQAAKFEEMGCKVDFEAYTDVDKKRAREIIESARKAGRSALTEPEAKELFAAYKIPVTKAALAKTPEEAVKIAADCGYPVVLKIVSPDILHKSDAGGVKVNIKDADGVRQAYQTILDNAKKYKADAEIHGILVSEMAPAGTEVICGSVNDATFGPTIMFGLGGIFVEVLKDVTFRVAPISVDCALGMQQEIKSYPMLQGVRGEKRRDQDALAGLLSRLSQLVSDFDNEIAETDANPVLLYEEGKGCRAVDARVILKKQ